MTNSQSVPMNKVPSASTELRAHQRKLYNDMLSAYGYVPGYTGPMNKVLSNFSPLGSGKTDTGLMMFSHMELPHLVVVADDIIGDGWKRRAPFYAATHRIHVFTYEEIISIRGGEVKSGLTQEVTVPPEEGSSIVKRDNDGLRPSYYEGNWVQELSKEDYETTAKFKQMMQEGMLLVLDEYDEIISESKRGYSAFAMVRDILQSNSNSRVLLLSATPTTDPDNIRIILALHGILPAFKPYIAHMISVGDWVYDKRPLSYMKAWLTMYKAHIDKLEPTLYEELMKEYDAVYDQPRLTSKKFCAKVLDKVLKPFFTFSMPDIKPVNCLAYNLLTEELHTEQEKAEIRECIRQTKDAVEDAGKKKEKGHFFKNIKPKIERTEALKSVGVTRLAHWLLTSFPKMKWICQVNVYQALEKVKETLLQLGFDESQICYITGKYEKNGKTVTMPKAERIKQMKEFREHNLKKRVVIITSVGSKGIDLDDQSPSGEFPVFTSAMSTYDIKVTIQSIGRGNRTTSTSHSCAMVPYFNLEERMIDRLIMKHATLHSMTREGCLPITDKTPYARYHLSTGTCSFFTLGEKDEKTGVFKENLLGQIIPGVYREDAYAIYRTTNPIDLSDAYTPRSPGLTQIGFTMQNVDGSVSQACVVVATDLEIDTNALRTKHESFIRKQVQDYLIAAKMMCAVQSIVSRQPIEEGTPNYFYPGFRQIAQAV